MARFNETELRERYDAVVVPGLFRTGELDADREVNATEERFMGEVVDSLGLSQRALQFVLRFDHRMLVEPSIAEQNAKLSDDYLHRLQVSGVQTLASVERSRDETNFMIVHFAKYPLSAMAVRAIERFYE